MKIKHYDVFVIGTGTAGKTVAKDCAAAGLNVAIADNREYGGTCPNRGCDPKKVLVGATEVVQMASNLKGKGITSVPEISWKDLQHFKENFTVAIPAATEKELDKLGIVMYHQSPKFIDEKTLSVEGKTVTADKIVIATGMKPLELKIAGREHLLKSEDFLHQPELPDEIVFIGGGYIGMEFAHIAARCGSKVTIVERGSRPLKPFEKDIVEHLTEVSKDLGITFIFNADVTEVELLRTNYRVLYKNNGKIESVKAKAVFNTTGRIPAIAELELEKGNVAFEKEGVSVNRYLQNTTNPNIYACGDVSASGTLPLTPVSSYESKLVAKNIIKGNEEKLDCPPIPSVVFTIPQLAAIGLTEKEARQQDYSIKVEYKSVPNWFNAKRLNEDVYAYKTIVDTDRNLILGAHIIGGNAGEMVNLFVLAMCGKLTTDQLKEMVFAYPTWSKDIKGMV
ncbi:dihydrolipoyl dehydrogenase family protein [Patiriisocius marinus]|uniref:dihydrolipoyl dehydrogenase family protein n=1 Tax=Patiriisocius marinus TaxID=1397112 RepID=UPI00233073E3|nr:NAD(P)/FAD-dependent oxidoreductase [Patiriisocius marinus]